MLMATEKEVLYEIDNDEIIKLLKSKSTLLMNKLFY